MAALPTLAAGASDWADATAGSSAVRRVGLVHAMGNGLAWTLFAGSLAARRRGARGCGRLLALGGGAAIGAASFLGGHLSLARGIGVDQTAFDAPPHGWKTCWRKGNSPRVTRGPYRWQASR